MSFNTILKAARKLGMPVVITDREGAEAQVVMPFDDFVALTNSVPSERKRGVASGAFDQGTFAQKSEEVTADEDLATLFRAEDEESLEFSIEDLQMPSTLPLPSHNGSSRSPSVSSTQKSDSGTGMEEKFYLEPVDEDNF